MLIPQPQNSLVMQNADLPRQYYSLNETPWYFGAHLNQARHNLYLALNDLNLKINGKAILSDEDLLSCKALTILKQANPNPNELERAMEYYEKNFPFLFAMQYTYSSEEEKHIKKELREQGKLVPKTKNSAASAIRYHEILTTLITALNAARNHFSHYSPNDFIAERELIWLLNDAFDVNVRIIKHRFQLNDQQVLHLKRFDGMEYIDGKKCAKPNPKFRYSFGSKETRSPITEYGLAFFISLFLTKGEAFLFLNRISGFKRSDTPEFSATRDSFCCNTLRIPKERIESDNSPMAAFLDMCNELARCPIELYEQLQPDQQQLFVKNTRQDEWAEATDSDDTETDQPEAKLVRHTDRFTFFAQRFLDISDALPNLRFAVDLGHYHYSIYPKTIAGITENRQLTQHLLGYGKLEEFDKNKRPPQFQQLYKDTEAMLAHPYQPYIRETYPHYHTEGNNIPLYMTSKSQPFWPSVQTAPTSNKSYPNKLIKDTIPRPFAFLSTHEMPALLFYHLLQQSKQQGATVQEIITGHIQNTKRFFTDLLNGNIIPVADEPMPRPDAAAIRQRTHAQYNQRFAALETRLANYNLKPAYIPDNLVALLLNLAPGDWQSHAQRRLQEMIADAEQKKEKMEQREKADIKPGKKAFRKIKVGKLADILAEDMLLLQPVARNPNGQPLVSSKANSSAFRLLQSHLAYFGLHRHNMRAVFEACRLIGSPNPHPFLHTLPIASYPGIIEFYKAYFHAKAAYLRKLAQQKNYDACHFLYLKNNRASLQALAAAYLNKNEKPTQSYSSFNLPRGLFLHAIRQWLLQYGPPPIQALVQNQPQVNTLHLINQYFHITCNDEAQPFYQWPRQYRIFNTTSGKNEIPHYLSLEERKQRGLQEKQAVDALKARLPLLGQEAEKAKASVFNSIRAMQHSRNIQHYVESNLAAQFPAVKNINWKKLNDRYPQKDAARKTEAAIDQSVTDVKKQISAYSFFTDNEQYLRQAAAQDKLLFMCIRQLLQQKTGGITLLSGESGTQQPDTFLLKNIDPRADAAKSLLNCRPAAGIELPFHFFETSEAGQFVKNEAGQNIKAGEALIVDKHVKIKNAGNFRARIKDRRINNLCFYFEPDENEKITLNRMILENELRDYDARRPLLLQAVAAFEKAWYNRNNTRAIDLFYYNGVQQHRLYLASFFAAHPQMETGQLSNDLNRLRNAFLHNQFPLVQVAQRRLTVAQWQACNLAYQPAAKGSTWGYGVIQPLAQWGIEQYNRLTQTIQ
jgi:hypothetical protein